MLGTGDSVVVGTFGGVVTFTVVDVPCSAVVAFSAAVWLTTSIKTVNINLAKLQHSILMLNFSFVSV